MHPSFRDGSSKVQWRQWLIIYKDVLKDPWDDIAFQFRPKSRSENRCISIRKMAQRGTERRHG
jgi:hypothetical protein